MDNYDNIPPGISKTLLRIVFGILAVPLVLFVPGFLSWGLVLHDTESASVEGHVPNGGYELNSSLVAKQTPKVG